MGKSSGGVRNSGKQIKYTDVVSFEEFREKTKAVRSQTKHQNTGSFRHLQVVGTTYYVYIDLETNESINPFTKKDQEKKYKSFRSGFSADDAKRKAYEWLRTR